MSLFPLAPLWALALNADIAVPPAFDGSVGYFALTGDRIVAYDLREGTQKWIVDAKPLFEPAAGDGLLFSVEPETLTARSASDGSIVWSCALTDELAAPPAWDNGWLIVATRAHEVLAYRANDGRLIWRQKIAGDAHARPALVADRVYVPTDTGHVLALRVDTGDTVWDQSVNAAANDVLALDDRVYVGSNDNHLYCLLAKDGSVDWKWPTGGDVVGLASHDEHNVYFVSLDNVLRALGMKSGGQRWKAPLPMRPARGPTQAGDVLIVTGLTSKVAAFAAKDGKPAGDVPASGDLAAPPHLIATGAHALPVLIMVTRDIAKGATVTAFTRSVEPPVAPIAPLPNITTVPLPKS